MFQGIDHGTEAFLRFQAGNLGALDPSMRVLAYAAHPAILLLLVWWSAHLLGRKVSGGNTWKLLVAFVLGLAGCLAIAFLVARGRPASAGRYPFLTMGLPGFPALGVYLATVAGTWLLAAGNNSVLRLTCVVLSILLPLGVLGAGLVLGLFYLTDGVAGLLLGAGVALVGYSLAGASSPRTAATSPAGSG